MAILFKVSAVSGKYKDAEGNDKNRYVDMGVVMETKNGPMLKLEAFPVGWDGWAYLNEPKPREEGHSRRNTSQPEDDDPFGGP